MRSEKEILTMRDRFYQDLDIDPDDEVLDGIIAALNWVLAQSDDLLNHLSD